MFCVDWYRMDLILARRTWLAIPWSLTVIRVLRKSWYRPIHLCCSWSMGSPLSRSWEGPCLLGEIRRLNLGVGTWEDFISIFCKVVCLFVLFVYLTQFMMYLVISWTSVSTRKSEVRKRSFIQHLIGAKLKVGFGGSFDLKESNGKHSYSWFRSFLAWFGYILFEVMVGLFHFSRELWPPGSVEMITYSKNLS